MRVALFVPFAVVGFVLVVGAVFHSWVFSRVDGLHQWQSGFRAAQTPAEAMTKFRAAIQQRRYRWAAAYCTREYADVLVQSGPVASRLGEVIDDVQEYMKNRELQTDRASIVLNCLDPFPSNFEAYGEPQAVHATEAIGFFRWTPLPLRAGSTATTGDFANLETRMFQRALLPPQLFSPKGVRLLRDADGWKLNIVPTPEMIAAVNMFNERAFAYSTALGTFRTYMTNGRYESPSAFEREVIDVLRQANPGTR